MIRVLIADDQALVRTGLRMILENAGDMEVVGEAGDGSEAVESALRLDPDVVLMDIRMPEVDGVAAARQLRSAAPDIRVLVLTTFDLDEYVYAALRAGASGFLLKDALADDLLAAVRVVARGDAVVAPSVTRRLLERFIGVGEDPPPAPDLARLTEREREVLGLMAKGMSNMEIAAVLFLTEGTVKTHVSRVLSKLELRDRVHAVVYAYERGIVRPAP